jgi:hypothetical protein
MGAFGPSVHTLPVTVGHSRPGRGGNGLAGGPAGSRRQPVFGSRARVPMCGRRVRGCRRDGWPGCCGATQEQHKFGSGRGPTREQHGRNGIPRHTWALVLKSVRQPNYQARCA